MTRRVEGEQSFDRPEPIFGVDRWVVRPTATTFIGNVSSTLVAAAGCEAACMAERLQCARDREFECWTPPAATAAQQSVEGLKSAGTAD